MLAGHGSPVTTRVCAALAYAGGLIHKNGPAWPMVSVALSIRRTGCPQHLSSAVTMRLVMPPGLISACLCPQFCSTWRPDRPDRAEADFAHSAQATSRMQTGFAKSVKALRIYGILLRMYFGSYYPPPKKGSAAKKNDLNELIRS